MIDKLVEELVKDFITIMGIIIFAKDTDDVVSKELNLRAERLAERLPVINADKPKLNNKIVAKLMNETLDRLEQNIDRWEKTQNGNTDDGKLLP